MKILFIAGTDTGVGKTVITGLLARFLCDKGYRVVTQKWIQTGCYGFSTDVDAHLARMGKARRDFRRYLSDMMPYCFRLAVSPHLAACFQAERISAGKIKNSLNLLARHFDFVIVEGTGGLLVPISQSLTMADMVRQMKLPVVLVASNRLGAINHTLLSLEALKARRIKTLGVIFNQAFKGTDHKVLKDNPRIVHRISGESLLGVMPRFKDSRQMQQSFTKIGEAVLAKLKSMA